MTKNSSLTYYNIQIPTSPLVQSIAKLIFTLEGTTQVYSEVCAKQLDSRLPDIQLYQYQAKVYKAIKSNNNILVVSGTGSGKTEACFFPLLSMVKKGINGQVLAIYPTNVLAWQQQQRLQEYASWFGLRIHQWSGDTVKATKEPAGEIITSNPNFLLENLKSKIRYKLFQEWFLCLETIIFDEIHMYDARQIALLTETLNILRPKQIIFLSATVGNLDEVAKTISNINGKATYTFRGSKQKAMTQYIVLPDMSQIDLVSLLLRYLVEPGMSLVFTQTIAEADQLRRATVNAGLQTPFLQMLPLKEREDLLNDMITVHHSSLSTEDRRYIEERLKHGSMLVFSPKTLAQGIDVANVVRIIHIGLPNSLADFLQREGRAGRRKETKWTESIIIIKNAYDDLIMSNQATFEAYIKGTPERILLLPNSPTAELFRACFHFKCEKNKLSQIEKELLKEYRLVESIGSSKFTKFGDMFWKEELSFYGPLRHIYFLNKNGTKRYNPDKISARDLYLKYQPNTLHYKYGVLQRVVEYQGEGKGVTPVFEIVKDQIVNRLYKHNSLRSYIVKQIIPSANTKLKGGISHLVIRAVQVSISFLRTDVSPAEYEIYQTFPADTRNIYLLTTYLPITFNFSPINMEMAIHCFIQALRITQDIRYTEIEHSLLGKFDKWNEMTMLLYEANFSGLLLHLNYANIMEAAREIASHYFDNNTNDSEVYPLPTCRYLKKKKDILSRYLVEQAFIKIENCAKILKN